jgi:hypothetical protein
MNQALYAHMNNKRKMKTKKRKNDIWIKEAIRENGKYLKLSKKNIKFHNLWNAKKKKRSSFCIVSFRHYSNPQS